MDAAGILSDTGDERERCEEGKPVSSGSKECPLQCAMQRVTRAAVTQLVLYADGECAPRLRLLHELERWQRLHSLLATHICPTRRHSPLNDADVSAAQALVPEAQFDALREMIRRCGECGAADACPLEREPQLELFGER